MTAPSNTQPLGSIWRGRAWDDGQPITRVPQSDGSTAEAIASLAYVLHAGIWVPVPGDAVGGMAVTIVGGGTPATPTVVLNGGKNVAVTGTAVQLPAGACSGAVITANSTNAGNVFVGSSTVTNNRGATTSGAELQPGQSIGVAIANLSAIYVNGTAGDGVNWLAS